MGQHPHTRSVASNNSYNTHTQRGQAELPIRISDGVKGLLARHVRYIRPTEGLQRSKTRRKRTETARNSVHTCTKFRLIAV